MKIKLVLCALLTVAIASPVLAQSTPPDPPGGAYAQEAEKMFRASFRADNTKEWMDRLDQDDTMRTCGLYRDTPPRAVATPLEKANRETIRYPADGKLMGDWKEGEKLAAIGTGGHVGFIQPDPPGRVRGGNCYACHELAKKELAYGTIGPSLRNYAKKPSKNPEETIKRVYDKVYNSNSLEACTNMPRYGLHGWLTPEQITHVVAFLLDPQSPVNKD